MADQQGTVSIRGAIAKLARWAAILWIQIGITIVLFAAVSALAGVAVKVIRHARRSRTPTETQAYPQAPWAPAYFRAMNSVHMRWYPYVYWKTAPMRSPYLNIDQQSNRVTWNKPHRAGDGRPLLRVFSFGGSTTWGAGARDDFTIPSLIAKRLADQTGFDVRVSNYGQMGWVSTQEVVYLYRLLARGRRPDLVIFYDGVNDCFLGYQNGIAGLTQNEFLRAKEFGLLSSSSGRKRLYGTAIRTALMNTGLADLIKLISGRDEDNVERHEIKPVSILAYLAPPRDFEGTAAVEQDVADNYLFNKKIVETLGRRFGFRVLFYWQPVIYSKHPLTAFERHFLGADSRREFFDGTYKLVAADAQKAGVYDISGILDGGNHTYFIDPWHITEAGNAIVADRMADDAAPILAQIARERQAASGSRDGAGAAANQQRH